MIGVVPLAGLPLCPRCSGQMLRDLAGEESCLACGYEYILSVPLSAIPPQLLYVDGRIRREAKEPSYSPRYEW